MANLHSGWIDDEFDKRSTGDPEHSSQGIIDPELTAQQVAAVPSIGWMPRLAETIGRAVAVTSMVAVPLLPPSFVQWPQAQANAVQIAVPYRSVVAFPLQPQASLSWHQPPTDAAKGAVSNRPVLIYPLQPPVTTITWWDPRQFDRARVPPWSPDDMYAVPPSVPPDLGIVWWPQFPDRTVQRVRFQEPLTVGPPSMPMLPWLMPVLPNVLAQYPTRHVLALNPTTPTAGLVIFPWLVPPGQVVFPPVARYEPLYAKPIQPQDPSGRSDLPWLWPAQPNVLAQLPIRHVLALNPTTPAAQVQLPWLVPPGQLIVRSVARYDSTYASPLQPPQVQIPWLIPPGRLVFRPVHRYDVVYAKTIQPLNPDGRSDLPWLPQAPPGTAKPIAAPSSMAMAPPGGFLAPGAQTDWIIVVPSWPDTIIIEAYPDWIIVSAFPDDVDVP